MMKHLCLFLIFLSFYNNSNAQSTGLENEWLIGTGEIIEAAFSPTGNEIAIVGNNGFILFNGNNFQIISSFKKHNGFDILEWSPNGQKIFFAEIYSEERSTSISSFSYFSETNFILDMISNNVSTFDGEISWGFSSGDGRPANSILPREHINFRFSLDATKIGFRQLDGNLNIIDLDTRMIETPLFSELGSEFFNFNFTTENDYLTIFTSIPSEVQSQRNLNLLFIENDTLETVENKLFENTNSGIEITNDAHYIFRKSMSSATGGTNFYDYILFDLVNGHNIEFDSTTIYSFSPVKFERYKFLYLSGDQTFVVARTGGSSFTRILVKNANDGKVLEGSHLKVISKFSQPFSNDGSLFLAEDSLDEITFPYVFPPNYNLYVFDWRNKSYEHALPRSAPQLIAFISEGKLVTHTNRITEQFFYEWTDGDLPLDIIPNKYSQPITEIWSPEDQAVVGEVFGKPFYEIGVFSSSNQLFASPIEPISATQTKINIYDAESWESVFELPVDAANTINSIAFSPNDNLFLAAHESVELWDTANGEKTHTFSQHDGSVYHAAFSDDSSHVLSCGRDGRVNVYDLASNSANTLIEESSPVIFTDYLGNETQIIYTLDNGATKVLDMSSGEVVSEIPAELGEHTFRAVKLSADQHYLIVGNQIWDIAAAEQINTIAAFAEPIEDLQVSSDGKWIATRHSDFTARVWHTVDVFQRDTAVVEFERY